MAETIPIQTNHPYQVVVGQGLLEKTYETARPITDFRTVVIVSDDNVAPLYLQAVRDSFPETIRVESFLIPHGEQSKNAQNLFKLMDFCAGLSMTRTDLLVALGGGVVGDLTGFAASIYLRGIPYLQIPTTLLAQVDSSVGGKTAIDIPAGKNLVGTFYQPAAVLCDTGTLSTLTPEIFHDGVAEIIKYGCIYDETLFEQIPDIRRPETLAAIIKRCIEIKAEVVCQDEFDKGLRMILNFGHTIGHAIEKYYHYEGYTHGQGVAIGMAFLTGISERAGYTKPGTTLRLLTLLRSFDLPISCGLSNETLEEICALDKKNLNGGLNLILISKIGTAFVHKVNQQEFQYLLTLREPGLPEHAAFSPSHLKGTVTIPPSKSLLHRALICAALARGTSSIHHFGLSEDITATMDCLTKLGASFKIKGDTVLVNGIATPPDAVNLQCEESGSTLRFLIPVASAFGINAVFHGKNRLVERPLDIYQTVLSEHGIKVDYSGNLPFQIAGTLRPGIYQVNGNVSSQFITGLLFALPLLEETSRIEVLPPFESKSYVDITLHVLSQFGIRIEQTESGYLIPGGQQYRCCEFTVESDYSQAAFFLVADALGADIALKSFPEISVQGDREILAILKRAGAKVHLRSGTLTCRAKTLTAFEADGADIPDLVPILAVLACFCKGTSHITHTERLKLKESDRIASTLDLIRKMGGIASYQDGTITIEGVGTLSGAELESFNDHRIAMCAAVAASAATGSTILHHADCVKKSYPAFFDHYRQLGGCCHVLDLE